ncbi:hypothetical protein DRA42_03590 [Ethanoligenens harbinense]|nr:hypothetical protein CXQ68_03595 [Ethanoligenens harbinense YUAN-3]AYF38067.1 hypothetical protein CXP51_03450 [Ethanoligenens harbinense]AYF40812.1 hypothetical protein CN246_03585 [Ethanoligenens harbinense]QCN91643.1 hypothetical protein DRA42_03590 [Ethanoligenens harbinense]
MKMPGTDDSLLFARADDALRAVGRYAARFVGFLDEREQAAVLRHLSAKHADASFLLWGGYADAERRMLGVFPQEEVPDGAAFPITAVQIIWKGAELNHRDFLGALLSLGLKREKVGDLVVRSNDCVAFLENAVAAFVRSNLSRVGRIGVSCEPYEGDVRREAHFAEIGGTVASERLDCVVAALTGCSRTQAEDGITAGRVALDFRTVTDRACRVPPGASLSIRGCGRFVVDELGPPTRKGRLRFAARKYV